MEHLRDKHEFSEAASAAPHIFSYVARTPVLATLPLEFEYGLIDRTSGRAVAKFSCATGTGHAVFWVSAITQLDGSWRLNHTVGSAG